MSAELKPLDIEKERAEDAWRRLALQFDGHRMQALGHLRMLLKHPDLHAPVAAAFLSAPPLDGETVLAERIAALAAKRATPPSTSTAMDVEIGDLAALIRQLAYLLKKASPNNDLSARAIDYLQRKGLAGSPLRRADATTEAPAGAARRSTTPASKCHDGGACGAGGYCNECPHTTTPAVTGEAGGDGLLAEALAVFDLMLAGCREQKFGDYENGDGETIGPRMDALHVRLRAAVKAAGQGGEDALVEAERKGWQDGMQEAQELLAEEIRDAARWRYIEEHASTYGGGLGFTIKCFVPVDHEDMGVAIDVAIERAALTNKADGGGV